MVAASNLFTQKQLHILRALESKIHSQPAFTRFTAAEFVLYESHLGDGGARYEVRMGVELARG